ncbi:unnamed protein product, partial [Polarella glacialis]
MASPGSSATGPTLLSCPICREDELEASACSQAKACGHSFCWPCIERWAKSCSQCPLCKREMGSLVPMGRSKKPELPTVSANSEGQASSQQQRTRQRGRRRARAVPQRRLELPQDEE